MSNAANVELEHWASRIQKRRMSSWNVELVEHSARHWNKSSERPVRSESLKLLNTIKQVKILFFLWFTIDRTDSKWNKILQYQTFYKTHCVYSYNHWNYFLRGCIKKLRSGNFSIHTWCIPLKAFASKKEVKLEHWASRTFSATLKKRWMSSWFLGKKVFWGHLYIRTCGLAFFWGIVFKYKF